MKKLLCCGLAVSCLVLLSASASSAFDLSAMSWEELVSLKAAVREEMRSRPESAEEHTLVDNEYITASFVKVTPAAGIAGYNLYLTIRNNTDSTVKVAPDDASINDYQIALVMSGVPMKLNPGKIGTNPFILPLAVELTDIETISFCITVDDPDTYKEIYRTEMLTVEF